MVTQTQVPGALERATDGKFEIKNAKLEQLVKTGLEKLDVGDFER
jgi:hypothetical protein